MSNQFYDIWPWYGTSAYVAGIWLATLTCAGEMAEIMGDVSFAEECREWLERGRVSYEEKLWNGEYYRLYNDAENGKVSDTCLANQLMAQWCVRLTGGEDVLPGEHITSAIESIKRLNFAATQHGLVNGVKPDGSPDSCGSRDELESWGIPADDNHASQIFFGENMCAAMTFMYAGHKEFGIEIAKRLYESVAIDNPTPWNQRCLLRSKDGGPAWGDDYNTNMVLWALPMAIQGKDIGSFCQDQDGILKSILRKT